MELNPGDAVVARDVAYTAMEWGLGDHAYPLLRRVSRTRPYEPQTYHAMARCLEDMGRPELAVLWYEVALGGRWPERFGAFDRIVGLDYQHFLRRVATGELESALTRWGGARLEQLAADHQPAVADVLVSIQWNTDRTDVDLHVLEPTGELCYYSHPNTKIGGALTRDVTQGYGPEMYVLPAAVNGDYWVRAHYYSSDRNRASVRTKVHARVYLGWGTEHEEVSDVVVPLPDTNSTHDIIVVRAEK